MNPAKRPCLPLLKSMAEAVALSKKEQDTFYIDTLHIHRWLARANKEAVSEYAEKKNPRQRSLQSGSAWRLFGQSFGDLSDPQFASLFRSMARLSTYDDPVSRCLAEARFPLRLEHDCSGDYFGPKTPDLSARPAELAQLLRRTTERWCDWLDAANHLHAHRNWHHTPIYFDPDVEKRDLAGIGLVQRNYSELNDWMKGAWQHLHTQFAERHHNSPKWLTVGQAMASPDKRVWPYHQVDTCIIYLWPLVKLHNWTYRDLMKVVRTLIARPQAYPCRREHELAVHCRTVLGLRKNTRGKSNTSGRPPGCEIAQRIFRPARKGVI